MSGDHDTILLGGVDAVADVLLELSNTDGFHRISVSV